jgi:hypothetical protein
VIVVVVVGGEECVVGGFWCCCIRFERMRSRLGDAGLAFRRRQRRGGSYFAALGGRCYIEGGWGDLRAQHMQKHAINKQSSDPASQSHHPAQPIQVRPHFPWFPYDTLRTQRH